MRPEGERVNACWKKEVKEEAVIDADLHASKVTESPLVAMVRTAEAAETRLEVCNYSTVNAEQQPGIADVVDSDILYISMG